MTEKKMAALDQQIERLQAKISKLKHEYDVLLEELNELMAKRYPEKQEECEHSVNAFSTNLTVITAPPRCCRE